MFNAHFQGSRFKVQGQGKDGKNLLYGVRFGIFRVLRLDLVTSLLHYTFLYYFLLF
jgi:hypothetical protein